MTVKNISTRAKICGRSANCTGGHSAVEQSSYISREKMHCEYDGQTYYPKYSEDLVHCEVLLPENAPEKYKDPYVLWNSVELVEKSKDAQLARTFRIEQPNEWSYERVWISAEESVTTVSELIGGEAVPETNADGTPVETEEEPETNADGTPVETTEAEKKAQK